MPLFLIFIIFNIHSYNKIILSFILHQSPRPIFLYPHRFYAQQEKPPLGAEPILELRPALQQAANYQLSYAAPYWTTPHPTELRLTLTELRHTHFSLLFYEQLQLLLLT